MSEDLFLSAAIDVQQGSKNDPNNPSRLEIEAMGHGVFANEAKEGKNDGCATSDDGTVFEHFRKLAQCRKVMLSSKPSGDLLITEVNRAQCEDYEVFVSLFIAELERVLAEKSIPSFFSTSYFSTPVEND